MEMSVRYKMSNEVWICSGVFGCQWLYLPRFTLCDTTCTPAAIPAVFLQSSGRAATADPPTPPALWGWNATQARPKWCCLENRGGLKARVPFFMHMCYHQFSACLDCVLPSVQCLSDCLASLDKKMPGDTPFAVLSNILSKSLMTGLRKFVPSGEIFLTKFRYWLYRCLF